METARRRRPGGRRYFPRRKVCGFCVDRISNIDYKDVGRLRRYISIQATIEPRRKTGTCAPHQRALSMAIKRARFTALLPYASRHSLMDMSPPDRDRGDRFRGGDRRERTWTRAPGAPGADRTTYRPPRPAESAQAPVAAAVGAAAPSTEAAEAPSAAPAETPSPVAAAVAAAAPEAVAAEVADSAPEETASLVAVEAKPEPAEGQEAESPTAEAEPPVDESSEPETGPTETGTASEGEQSPST